MPLAFLGLLLAFAAVWSAASATTIYVDGGNATFIFTDPGKYAVNLTVSDPAGNLNGTTFTVNILDVAPPNLTIIQKFLNATEDVPLYLNRTVVNGTDVGGNLTWFWSDGAGGLANSTGPDIAWLFVNPGDYNLTLIVKDPQNNTAAGYILVHVFDVTLPVIMINGPGVIDVFLNASFNSTGTFDNGANSTPAQLNYTWVFSKGTTNLAVQYGPSSSFRPNASGDVLVTLYVRDTSGNTGNVSTLLRVNLPPIIVSSPPTETNLSTPWSWTPDVIDPEGQTVTINVSQGPAGMTVSGDTVTWTPAANQTGAQNVTLAFFDGYTTVFRSFTVFVVDPASFAGNHLPVFESEPPTDARVRTDYLYDITVTDADGDLISITVTGLDGATYNTGTHRLRWTPPWQPGPDEHFERDIAVKITAFDGKQTSTQEFVVRFRNPANIWPQLIGSFSIGSVHVGDTIFVRLVANWTDRDDQIRNLTFAINDTDPTTRALQASIVRWHVDLTDPDSPVLVFEIIGNGSVTFNFVARDPSGGRSDNALVVVNAVGARPPVTSEPLPWWMWLLLAVGGLAVVGGVIVSLRKSQSASKVAQSALDTASKAPTERVIVQQMPAAAAEAKKDTYLIEGIFVIYQDGRMIYSKTDIGNVKLEDPELIASMFSAVTSFIKDSFKQQGELNRLGFGDNTILIERGTYVFMAAIVYGEPTPELADSMRETIRTIENAYAGIIEEWDGSVTSLEAIDEYLAPFLATTAHLSRADVDQALKEKGVKMLSELEFFQGFVRLKCGVKNDTDSVITKVTVSIDFNEDVLRLHHIEPETYKRQGSEVQLGVLNPGEKVSVAYYFDPQICTESQIDGIARYRDSKGAARSVTMKTRKAEVVCPIFFTKEHANTAMLKRLVEGELDQRDSKVFNVVEKPSTVTWTELFALTKEVVLSHDVHMVREFLTQEPFHGEAWLYGETKVKGYKIVIRTSLIEEGGRIEFFAASTVIPAITGLLAEFNHTLQSLIGRKFSTVKLEAEYSETVKDDIQKKSLRAQMGEGELEGGETEQRD